MARKYAACTKKSVEYFVFSVQALGRTSWFHIGVAPDSILRSFLASEPTVVRFIYILEGLTTGPGEKSLPLYKLPIVLTFNCNKDDLSSSVDCWLPKISGPPDSIQ